MLSEYINILDRSKTENGNPIVFPTPKERQAKRVAAYCRVSTAEDEQLNSYETQCQYYDEYIASHEDWKKVAIFADEGITGTQAKKTPAVPQNDTRLPPWEH